MDIKNSNIPNSLVDENIKIDYSELKLDGNDEYDLSLRPQNLEEYIGQASIKEQLNVFIQAARGREESLDHTLLYGPPGLGKTTLANIIANEMGAKFQSITAPSIDRVGDMVAVLSNLSAGDVLFIDEIHRLPKVIEEVLYSAMEDFVVDVMIGKGATANTIRIDLPPFTLIGATTRFGDLTAPLRDRFGIIQQLNYYRTDELSNIIKRTSKVYSFGINNDAANEIARRSRGTPRVANRLFRRVRDFAQFEDSNATTINLDITKISLNKLQIDNDGLNQTDIRYLRALIERFKGGPTGVAAIASSISEEVTTVEDVYEPYLLQEGFIIRTSRGRMVTQKAYEHLGFKDENRLF